LDLTADVDCAAGNTGLIVVFVDVVVDGKLVVVVVVVVDFLVVVSAVVTNTRIERKHCSWCSG